MFRSLESKIDNIVVLLKALKKQGDHIMTASQDMQQELGALDTFVMGLAPALEAMIAAHDADDEAAFAAAASRIKADLATATAAVNPAPAPASVTGVVAGPTTV